MRPSRLVLALSLALVSGAPALAANWPDKPVTLVLPYPPGGNVDGAARIIGDRLQARLGQPFIVENRSGAGGLIAGEYVARAKPDGYTFFMGANGPILFSPTIFSRKNAYDWKTDFLPVSLVSVTPLVMQVSAGKPYADFAALMAQARQNGNALTMASPGAGTQNHLVSEYLQRETGATWTTAHYRGNSPATMDVIGGQVDFNFDQLSVAQPLIQEGRTRALAVTSAQRVPQLPNVPTLQELGLKDFTALTFTGILAPAKTPDAIVQTLSSTLQEILAEPEVRKRFETVGAEARGSSPEDFTAYLTREDARWMPIIEQAGIAAQ